MSGRSLPGVCQVAPEVRERFGAGHAAPEERSEVLRHLFAGCVECRTHLRSRVGVIEPRPEPALPFAKLLANVADFDRRMSTERAQAAEQFEDFRQHPVQRQWTLLRNSSRYTTYAFTDRLLEASYEAIYDGPKTSLDYAEMALHVAEGIEPETYGERSLHDLRGRVWSALANSRRASSDLVGAEQAMRNGAAELGKGTGEPLAEAEHLYYAGSLHRAQRRFDSARAALARSRRIYRETGDAHLEGRSMLNEAVIFELEGDLPSAIERIEQATPKIDANRDPHLALGAQHNLLWCLTAAGRGEEALVRLAEIRPRYAEVGDRHTLLLLSWMEARIAKQMGRVGVAEAKLRETLDSFVELGLPYEAAVVGFDLAALFADAGRMSELKSLSSDLVAFFHRLGVAREALAALLLFEKAARAETVTRTLVSKLASYFERAKREPGVRFDPGV